MERLSYKHSRSCGFAGNSEVEYTEDELEFMKALDMYKRENRRPFPTCSEVLQVLKSLGYRKP